MHTNYAVTVVTLRDSTVRGLARQLEELKKTARRERKTVAESFWHTNKTHYAQRVVLTHKSVAKFTA